MNTNSWINFAIKETESALNLLYSYMGFHEQIEKEGVEELANKNAEFWRVYIASVQHTLFIYLGRLSDDTRDGKSFSNFRTHCIKNAVDFSETSVRARKNEVLKLNPNYFSNSTFLNKQGVIDEFTNVPINYNKLLRAECKTIRSKVFAHAILIEEYEYRHLFESVDLKRVEEALLAMWLVSQNLWQVYHNAKTFDQKTFSEKENIYDSIYNVIIGRI